MTKPARTCRVLAVAFALSACRRAPPEEQLATVAAPSASSASSASSAEAGAAPTAASAQPPLPGRSSAPRQAPCDLRAGFHGTVAGQEVFLRLERAEAPPDPGGIAVRGRYFYAKRGVDIALTGTIDSARRIRLIEGTPPRSSGTFEGTCDAASGALDGSWTNGKAKQPFHVDRVGPRESPLVARKSLRMSVKAQKRGAAPPWNECSYKEELVEIFGAATPEAERAINQQGASDAHPRVASPELYDEVSACAEGVVGEHTESVTGVYRGLLTIERGGWTNHEGAAHPSNGEGYDRTTYDLLTGSPVRSADVYASPPAALVKRCVAFAFDTKEHEEDPLAGSYPDGTAIDLGPKGVHLWSAGYPHFAGASIGRGPTLSWAALLREGALRADSPVKRAWEGVEPAKPGDPLCYDEDGHALR